MSGVIVVGCIGLGDEILSVVADVPSIKVTARCSNPLPDRTYVNVCCGFLRESSDGK